MPKPEILAHTIDIPEDEVFQLIGVARTLPEIQASQFGGRVELWAEERIKRGDQVDVVVTYKENGHHVSFVEHQGVDPVAEEEFDVFHVACDCALGFVDEATPEGLLPKMADCSHVQKALMRRAAWMARVYKTDEVLAGFRDPKLGDFEQTTHFHHAAMNGIAHALELDALHPYEWPATLISGQHQASIMAAMLQVHPYVVNWYGEMMESAGIIHFDGETMRLTDHRYQELVDALEDA